MSVSPLPPAMDDKQLLPPHYHAQAWACALAETPADRRQSLLAAVRSGTEQASARGGYWMRGATNDGAGWGVDLPTGGAKEDDCGSAAVASFPPALTSVQLSSCAPLLLAECAARSGYRVVLAVPSVGGKSAISSKAVEVQLELRTTWLLRPDSCYAPTERWTDSSSGERLDRDVVVFRGAEAEGYPFAPVPFEISAVLAVRQSTTAAAAHDSALRVCLRRTLRLAALEAARGPNTLVVVCCPELVASRRHDEALGRKLGFIYAEELKLERLGPVMLFVPDRNSVLWQGLSDALGLVQQQ